MTSHPGGLIVEEAGSSTCRRLLRADSGIGVWALSKAEVLSAYWLKVDGLDAVRTRAERILAVHWPFVTGDVQLARVAELEGFNVIVHLPR